MIEESTVHAPPEGTTGPTPAPARFGSQWLFLICIVVYGIILQNMNWRHVRLEDCIPELWIGYCFLVSCVGLKLRWGYAIPLTLLIVNPVLIFLSIPFD
jgi:hypothetical protein